MIAGKSNFNMAQIQNVKYENIDYLYQQGKRNFFDQVWDCCYMENTAQV